MEISPETRSPRHQPRNAAASPAESRSALPGPAPAVVSPRSTGSPLLIFDRVSKWYGPVLGVNQVTLELRKGITGLVGPNGAGKSTLLRLAAGQLRPDLGVVQILGHEAWTLQARQLVGYCPDSNTLFEEMSGREFLQAMARLCGFSARQARERTSRVLHLVSMDNQAHRPLRGYSRGMRQRIKMAQALLHDPPLLILDEPFSGIDPVGRMEFTSLFRRLMAQGKCLLVSSHELEELEKLTDHVVVMAGGRVAAVGTLLQIRDLLDNHPLSVRVDTDQPRQLAGALLALDDVVGVELRDGGAVLVKARNPRRFFQALTTLILEEQFEVSHVQTLDESAQAVLGYLLGGGRP